MNADEQVSEIVKDLLKKREMTIAEIEHELDLPMSYVTGILKKLLNDKEIKKIPRGDVMKFRVDE